SDLHNMIHPSCNPHFLTDNAATQARNYSPVARLSVGTVACYTAVTCSDGNPPRLRAQSGCDTARNGRIPRREHMAKIKHIALTTHDLEKVASFYKDVFGMTEVGRGGSTHIYLSDGDLNLTIRACKKSDDADVGEQGENFSGIHHIGF